MDGPMYVQQLGLYMCMCYTHMCNNDDNTTTTNNDNTNNMIGPTAARATRSPWACGKPRRA